MESLTSPEGLVFEDYLTTIPIKVGKENYDSAWQYIWLRISDSEEIKEEIKDIKNLRKLNEIMESNSKDISSNWNKKKNTIVNLAIYALFSQNSKCRDTLSKTQNKDILLEFKKFWRNMRSFN